MKKSGLLVVPALVLLLTQACHHHDSNEQEKIRQQRRGFAFIKNSLIGGLCEIKASGYAITNSNNHAVIDLAKMMITQQTAIDSDLVKLKAVYQITVRDTIDAFDAKWIDSLSKKSGPAFDKQYVNAMVGIHRADSILYRAITKQAGPDVDKFVQKNLPAVSRQLDSAVAVSKSLK